MPSPLVLSTTAFGEVTRCLKLYEYHQRDGLVPLPSRLPPRMRRGTWIHRALQYGSDPRADLVGLDWRDGIRECEEWALQHGVDEQTIYALRDECMRILTAYYAYYATQPRWNWDVEASEEPRELQVSPTLTLRATKDKRVIWRGRRWLIEHKTVSEIPSASWRAIDPQTALQYAIDTLTGVEIEGIIFDYLLTREPPVPRVKQDGRFYAGTEKQTTTSEAFDIAQAESKSRWNGKPVDPLRDATSATEWGLYVGQMRELIVNDGAFFKRFEVYRPLEAVAETLRDARDSEAMIRVSEQLGHFRRLNNQYYCQRFCLYQSVCAAEYIGGRRSGLRDSEYMIEDPNDREGRDPQRMHDGN